jgi:hypothetical protein
VRIERGGVLLALREFAARQEGTLLEDFLSHPADARYLHLLMTRENSCYYIPVDFPQPCQIQLNSSLPPVVVCSSQRVAKELEQLNIVLQVEKTFKLTRMVDFMQASEEEISNYEKYFDTGGDFWVKFGFVILRKLVTRSLEHSLPIHFR